MRLIVLSAAALGGLALGDVLRLDPGPLALAASLALLGAVCSGHTPAARWLALVACVVALGGLRAALAPQPNGLLSPQAETPAEASQPARFLADVRTRAEAGIRRYLPEPQASLAAGVLLGGSGRLDAEFKSQLQRSGLSHLVAIDGFKQVVVAASIGALSVPVVGRRWASLPILLGIVGYTLVTGAHPSAVRAGLMLGLATLAALCGRVADPLSSLLLAVLLMALVEPRILLDVGLQLSLSAVLGIVLLWPRLKASARGRLRRVPRWIVEPVGLTLAVTLATLPIVLSVFQLVSLVSPVAHVLAVPLLPLVLASTALLALAAPVEPLAHLVAGLAWLPTTLLVRVVGLCGSLPGAALATGRLPPAAAGGLAAGLLAWGLWGLPEAASVRTRWQRLRASQSAWLLPATCALTCLGAAALLALVKPDGRLHVQTLAAGRGEAVLIRGPTGQTTLVVGGSPNPSLLASQVASRLPVWEHKLDAVLPLDATAASRLGATLGRYPADRQLQVRSDAQAIDLGGGATLGVSSIAGQPKPGVSISFGRVWLPVPPGSSVSDLVSDGFEISDASGSGET